MAEASSRELYEPVFVGREEILSTLWELALKGRNTLLWGEHGMGKSAILERLYRGLREGGEVKVLFVEDSRNLKPILMSLAQQLHAYGLFSHPHLSDGAVRGMTWRKLLPKVRGLGVPDLARAVIASMQGRRCLVLLDQLERLLPTGEAWLNQVVNVATVIVATADAQARSLRGFLQRIPAKVEVPPLSREETYRMIEACCAIVPVAVQDPEHYRRTLYHASGGNPKRVKDMLADHSLERRLDRQGIRELDLEVTAKYFATSWGLFGLMVLFGAVRYIGRGIGDRDSFIIGAVMMLVMMLVGYFVRRANRS